MQKEGLQKVSVALLDNSYDFIEKGLEAIISDNEEEYKYSILHLYSGVLLFLKDILYKEHWTLIFQDVNQAEKQKLIDGDIKSVNFETLIKRIKNTDSFNISIKLLNDLNWLRMERNKIEHLHNQINSHEVKSRIASTLINLLNSIYDHKTSQGYIEDDYIDNYNYEYIEFINLFHGYSFLFKEFIDKRNRIIKNKVENSYLIVTCPNCEQQSMEIDSDNYSVFCHFCLTTSSIEAFISLNIDKNIDTNLGESNQYICPECDSNNIYEYDNKIICFECFIEYGINSLGDCSKCGSTYEIIEGEYIDVCDNCIKYMWKRD